MQLVLSSGSPRRRQLLTSLGLEFEVVEPGVDESAHPNEAPDDYVKRIAEAKALTAWEPGRVVLGADTTVVHHGQMLGKPVHAEEARGMLRRLAGEAHTVFTGVAVAYSEDSKPTVRSDVVTTVVRLSPLTDQEIAAYVETGEPLDKAGAYALQGLGGMFVEAVEGSSSNVVGLPLHVAARLLRVAGVRVLDL